MAEKEIRKICKCASCGNESEMTITCSLDLNEASDTRSDSDLTPRTKGLAVCSHCGNEADIWVDN
jgi:hypothetical protein